MPLTTDRLCNTDIATMGLRDMLRKKDEVRDTMLEREQAMGGLDGAEFTFIRTDTTSQELIHLPDGDRAQHLLPPKTPVRSPRPSLEVFRSSRDRSGSASSQTSHSSRRRLSDRLHLRRSPESSEYVPQNLPEITPSTDAGDESQWEKRATMLAGQNLARSSCGTPAPSDDVSRMSSDSRPKSPSPAHVSSKAIDEDIQRAIRLHEGGNLAESTKMFGRLADPKGANNPLSQVLYGLALRYASNDWRQRVMKMLTDGRHVFFTDTAGAANPIPPTQSSILLLQHQIPQPLSSWLFRQA